MMNKRATNFLRDPLPANLGNPTSNQALDLKFSTSLANHPISKFQKLQTRITSPLQTHQNSTPHRGKQASYEFSARPPSAQTSDGEEPKERKEAVSISKD
jgi:hypothetical protein